MAEQDSKQRSSSSLFGQTATTQHSTSTMQEVMRERKAASQARRKWLMAWLRPLLIALAVIIGGVIGGVQWQAHRARVREEQQKNVVDPMRGITPFGNEEAALKLEIFVPDMILAPQNLMTVMHRAVGIKPYKVCLAVTDISARDGLENSSEGKTSAKINGASEVEYLDKQGNRRKVKLEVPEMTPEILISAITLAYQETYGDDDPEHPFYIEMPKAEPAPKASRRNYDIDLQVDKLNPKTK